MKIYDNTKFYIITPANNYTGGPLSLHQLGSALKRLGHEVYMCYWGAPDNLQVHPWFKKFHLPNAGEVENKPHNIVITSETIPYPVQMITKAQIVVWWMSVDNHHVYMAGDFNEIIKQRTFLKRWTPSFHPLNMFELDHLVQSEYARQFLRFNGVPEEKIIHELRGYLAKSFYDNESKVDLSLKKDIVAYNPNKGFEFTQKIIESAPNLTFVPIQNMTPEQVQELLARSKVYIDFGNHPGRERIPRESTMSHCVVITSRRGSADNPIDVPIDDDFKFEDTLENIPKIIEKIRYVFENFKAEHDRQNSYRQIILKERDYFFKCVDEVFSKPNADKKVRSAIGGDLKDIEKMCDDFLNDKDVKLVYAVNDQFAGRKINYKNLLELEVISTADAEFLHYERRIDQFIMKKSK